MIKQVIRLIRPGLFLPCFATEPWSQDAVLVRPTYLSVCAADQRYFRGDRPKEVLRGKLPMALVHEAVGEVVSDFSGKFTTGEKVVLVPGAPLKRSKYLDNYHEEGRFYSSNCDGFTQEFLSLPHNQLVPVNKENEKVFVFAELVSVCLHGIKRWRLVSGTPADIVGIWGDGTLSYILALTLKTLHPEIKLVIFGKHDAKLAFFSFVDEVVNITQPKLLRVDHAFECVGGEGAESAIKNIINCIYPQGTITLLGVSETDPNIRTRMVLERGLTLLGCSRSNYEDFVQAVRLIQEQAFHDALSKIVSEEVVVTNARELEESFLLADMLPFKCIVTWKI